MIDAKLADSQIRRLSGLDFFPPTKAALDELSMALRVADTEAIARQVVGDLLAEMTACPKPAQMRQAAYAENERSAIREEPIEESAAPPRIHCSACHDFGIAESTSADDLASIAAYCACEAGRARSRRPDSFTPDRVNASRAQLRRLRIVATSAGIRRRSRHLAAVSDILGAIDGSRQRQGER